MTRLSHLRDVYAAEGPFATAYLDATRNTETANHEVELRWAAAKEQLAEQGAPEQTLALMEPLALTPTGVPGDTTLVLVANGEEVLYTSALPLRLPERFAWGAVPDLGPLAVALGRTAPYVLVHLDRSGADIDVVGPLGEVEEHEQVEGDMFHARKVKVGGWGHKRYQQSAENAWEKTADQVARELDRVVAQTGIDVLAVTGDTQILEKLKDAVGSRASDAWVTLESGGRGAGASEEAVREELGRVLAAHITRATDDPVSRFREQSGAGHGAAVSGRKAVVEALQKGQVDALLVLPDLDDESPLFIGPDPTQIATSADELSAMGVTVTQQARADAALLRATVATDAGIVVVPKGRLDLRDGVGALLRYADASTPS